MSEQMPSLGDVTKNPEKYMDKNQIDQSKERESTLKEGREQGRKQTAELAKVSLSKSFSGIKSPFIGSMQSVIDGNIDSVVEDLRRSDKATEIQIKFNLSEDAKKLFVDRVAYYGDERLYLTYPKSENMKVILELIEKLPNIKCFEIDLLHYRSDIYNITEEGQNCDNQNLKDITVALMEIKDKFPNIAIKVTDRSDDYMDNFMDKMKKYID